MIRKYLVGIVFVLMALMVFGLLEGTITGNIVKETNEKVVIYFPKSADFSNPEQGGVVFEFSFPDASFKVGNKSAEILMFLNSDTVPGLKIGYDTVQKKIYAGMPMLSSEEVTILDGNMHKLMYSFSRAEKKQWLKLDDTLLSEGKFTGESGENYLTGYSVYQKWTMIESPVGMEARFE